MTQLRHLSKAAFWCSLLVSGSAAVASATDLTFTVRNGAGETIPCRIHLLDAKDKPVRPSNVPFWRGGFVTDGTVTTEVAAGRYRYTVERSPEWESTSGSVVVADRAAQVDVTLKRLVSLAEEGWFSGDLHVHRDHKELPLHLQAEDLAIASVQTWWNQRNAWKGRDAPEPLVETNGRFYHRLSGEDERAGGALLYHLMRAPIDITQAEREWPASVTFLEEAKRNGAWAEIEKPFWWDTPLWLASGKIQSVGIAHNHMNRSGVLGNEAWGRPRDTSRYPGVRGNGLYTQDLYYKILNCGLRIPPSAGSASGVLPNPVGYNRVYVHTGAPLVWSEWWAGLKAGRSFVTNGPLLRLRANDRSAGEVFRSQGPTKIIVSGQLTSRDPIEKIELVQNGSLQTITLPFEFTVKQSGWFLVRAIADVDDTFRFASTAPWYVEIAGKTRPPDRDAATFFLNWAKERKRRVEQAIETPDRRRGVARAHQLGIEYWEAVVAKARPLAE